eukprot:4601397-Amphidinium_carterae.1
MGSCCGTLRHQILAGRFVLEVLALQWRVRLATQPKQDGANTTAQKALLGRFCMVSELLWYCVWEKPRDFGHCKKSLYALWHVMYGTVCSMSYTSWCHVKMVPYKTLGLAV